MVPGEVARVENGEPVSDATTGTRPVPSPRAGWIIDVIAAVALTAWYYRYGIGHFHDHLYDTFDQKGITYLMEWLYHCFFGDGRIAGVFDLNILYPNRNVLAWSDTMIGFLPVYAVARALTGNPILSVNAFAVTAVFAGALGMLRLGRDLTGRTSVIAATVGAVGMLAASQEGHLQMKGLALLIWAVLLLVRFLRGSGRAIPWLVVVVAWLFLSSIYFTIMLVVVVFTGMVAAACVGRGRFVAWMRQALRTIPWGATLGVAVLASIPVGWVASHYLQVKAQFGGYQLDEFVLYASRLGSLLDAPPSSVVYRTRYGYWGAHEARLCFGLAVWIGVAILAAGWRRWSMRARDRTVVALLALGAVLCIVLALGPYERDALDRGVRIPLPALLYARFFPGFSALRSIGRFGLVAAVFMGLLAELGIRSILDRARGSVRQARVGYVAIAAVFFVDQATVLKPYPIDLYPRRAVYEGIRSSTPADAVVLEIPVRRRGHFETISWWHEQMLGSILHWRRLPVGFTSLGSSVLSTLLQADDAFEAGTTTPAEFLAALRSVGITYVVVNRDLVPAEASSRLDTWLVRAGAPGVPLTASATLYPVR